MYHFDIPKTRQYDTGKVEIIARSSVGEAIASTELNVVQRKDDYRGVLKNSPRRKYSYTNELQSHYTNILYIGSSLKTIIHIFLRYIIT